MVDTLERTDEGQDVFLALDALAARIDRAYERLEQVATMADQVQETVTRLADLLEAQVVTLERLGRVLDMLDDPPPFIRAIIDRKARKESKGAAPSLPVE
jgi:predicted DNA-binding ArsR family transcriptional regulator